MISLSYLTAMVHSHYHGDFWVYCRVSYLLDVPRKTSKKVASGIRLDQMHHPP